MGYNLAIEAQIQGERTGYQPPAPADLRWRERDPGEQLPPLVMPITVTRCVFAASTTRDFSPLHHNRDYAREVAGRPDMFVNTPFMMGVAQRYVTDWTGPRARIRSLRLQIRGAISAGEDMIVTGVVKRWFEQDGEGRVEVAVAFSLATGPVTEAVVVAALPREDESA